MESTNMRRRRILLVEKRISFPNLTPPPRGVARIMAMFKNRNKKKVAWVYLQKSQASGRETAMKWNLLLIIYHQDGLAVHYYSDPDFMYLFCNWPILC